MSNTTASEHPRVLFFAMTGNFSPPVLLALLQHDIEVCAIVMPSPHSGPDQSSIQGLAQKSTSRSMLPMLHASEHPSLLQIASERQIPVWEVSRLSHPKTLAVLTDYRPDAICVACFSRRIPRQILNLPRFGCLNVHPSLLPANRGPEPLFWTFREGLQQTGVTIHVMDEDMDTGPLVAQEVIDVPDGMSYMQLESRCAALGGILLADSTWKLYRSQAHTMEQDETKSSYHPFPSVSDFIVNVAEWDARHVYNFICGLASWGEPITLQTGDRSIRVKTAISYSHKSYIPSSEGEEEYWIPCRAGSVKIKRCV